MDYGQSKQPANPEPEQAFFTAGAGTNSESTNNFEPENNLDLTNDAADWGQSGQLTVNKKIGNRAILSPELGSLNRTEVLTTQSPEEAPNQTSGFGEVIELELPPSTDNKATSQDASETTRSIDFSLIRGEGERISPLALRETQKTISDFNRGEITPAKLIDFKQKATEAYLENTYNRKLAI